MFHHVFRVHIIMLCVCECVVWDTNETFSCYFLKKGDNFIHIQDNCTQFSLFFVNHIFVLFTESNLHPMISLIAISYKKILFLPLLLLFHSRFGSRTTPNVISSNIYATRHLFSMLLLCAVSLTIFFVCVWR